MKKIYTRCPERQQSARRAWNYFTEKNKKTPKRIWHNANCFKSFFGADDSAWGMWVADYGKKLDYWNPQFKQRKKARNVFEFIAREIKAGKTKKGDKANRRTRT